MLLITVLIVLTVHRNGKLVMYTTELNYVAIFKFRKHSLSILFGSKD